MNKVSKKLVYISLEADIIHPGNMNIINRASKLGDLIVGLLTDKAIGKYKRLPVLNYEQRKKIVEKINGVKKVVEQDTYDYEKNLLKYKPRFVVHGDDWKEGSQRVVRKKVINLLSNWGGELIEVPYTKGISTSKIIKDINKFGTTPESRKKSLKKLLSFKPLVSLLEVHNGLTGLIVENVKVQDGSSSKHFDGMWLSSLTLSTSMGRPDTELVEFSSRFQTLEQILEVTTKPIIIDGDTGGSIEHFPYRVKTLERLGVSAIIIEDKVGNKRNSLFGTDVHQEQDTIENFSEKISVGKKAILDKSFMIIARVESLILEQGMNDAIKRTDAYIKSGADGIMIHSKKKDGKEIKEFCTFFKENYEGLPLVVVPSSYPHIKEKELIDWGASIVIYANHLIRSAYPAMINTAKSILSNENADKASSKYCMPIKEIISLIPEN